MRYLLKHGHLIIDGNREYLDGAILIEDGRIAEVFPQTDRIREPFEDCVSEDLKGSLVMPGFFDTHTHGAMGSVFDSADQDSLDEIAPFTKRQELIAKRMENGEVHVFL